MTALTQDKVLLFGYLCLGFWAVWMILAGVIPVVNFIVTGNARTQSLDKRWNLIMKGKKGQQFVLAQFFLFSSFVFSFILNLLSYRFWWIGLVFTLASIPFMIRATVNADRVLRKNVFFEIEDLWHS
jgi:hypothetical protein